MVAVVCPQLLPESFLRSIRHRHISLQYTLFTPPPPYPQTKIDFNFSWVEQSYREKAILILRGIQTVSARVVYWRTTHFIKRTVEPQIRGFPLSDFVITR